MLKLSTLYLSTITWVSEFDIDEPTHQYTHTPNIVTLSTIVLRMPLPALGSSKSTEQAHHITAQASVDQ